MLANILRFWRALCVVLTLFGIYWLPKDAQDYGAAAEPWQRAWSMVDQNGALWALVLVFGGWIIWSDVRPLWRQWRGPKYPSRHAAILQELADRLSEAKQVTCTRANALALTDTWKLQHWARFQAAREKAESLADQVSYDAPTTQTIRDYLHLCMMIVDDECSSRDNRDEREQLRAISGPIFQRLHDGKPINRDAIPLPQWMRDTGSKIRP